MSRSEEQGSLLVDTLTAVLVTAVIMSALAPLAARLFRLAAELIVTVDEILAFSEKLW
ncbi:MAG: hypothetical protein JXB03_09865 [Spirochaetales bacterium]|nr:hypothetical protein [Spirochaetales bacterium]